MSKNNNRYIEDQSKHGSLFSYNYIGDNLDDKHIVRTFRALIDKIDFSILEKEYSNVGGKTYHPKSMFSVICYSFIHGITSSRKIARQINESIPFMYLAGSCNITYRTILNFKSRHSSCLPFLLQQTINLAFDMQLLDCDGVFGLDGSKIGVYVSRNNTHKKAVLELRESSLVSAIDDYLSRSEAIDLEEDNLYGKENELLKKNLSTLRNNIDNLSTQKTQSNMRLDKNPNKDNETDNDKDKDNMETTDNNISITSLEEAKESLSEAEKIHKTLEKNTDVSGEKLLNTTDPDCRMMKNDGKITESYNMQAVSNNQIIVAVDVCNDENDQCQLEPMLEQTEKNLSDCGISSSLTIAADAGYNKGENLEYVDNKQNIDAYISMKNKRIDKKHKNNSINFKYNEKEDFYTCSEGKCLENHGEFIGKDGKLMTMYFSSIEQCIQCPLHSVCIQSKQEQKKGHKIIIVDKYSYYRESMRIKMEREDSKRIYARRLGEIEPVFGQIKHNRGINKIYYRGLESVKMEILWVAISHNLAKVLKKRLNFNQHFSFLIFLLIITIFQRYNNKNQK